MNIQYYYKKVPKPSCSLVETECGVSGDESEDEELANIYEATKSDEEFIASDDEAGEQEARETFASLLQDEEDARKWREHQDRARRKGCLESGEREKPVKPRKAPAPRIPTPPFIKNSKVPKPAKMTSALTVAGPLVAPTTTVPSWVVKCAKARARVRKRAKVSEEVPVLKSGRPRKRQKWDMAMFCLPAGAKKRWSKKASVETKAKGARRSNGPPPYQPKFNDDPYGEEEDYAPNVYGKKTGRGQAHDDDGFSDSDVEEVTAVASNFTLAIK